VTVEDPDIRAQHQIANFVRFCETVVKFAPTVRRLHLMTGYDEKTDLSAVSEKLEELKQSLLEADGALDIEVKNTIHDREVRIDNGWIIKIGRGLDFYQKPESWFAVGANDLRPVKVPGDEGGHFQSELRLKLEVALTSRSWLRGDVGRYDTIQNSVS
jgi:ATP-dependent Lon protease